MNRLFLYMFLVMFLFFCSGCSNTSPERPSDFCISLDWNTGALPPQYYYSYTIEIQPSGEGVFVYQAGYEGDESLRWQTGFMLDGKQMDDLYTFLRENDLLRSKWAEGQPLLGGSGTSIRITADGKEFLIPSISELEQDDRKTVQKAIDTINQLVPQEIWDEMNARQDAYENSYKE